MSANDKPQPFGVYRCKEMIHDILLQNGQKDLFMTHIRHKTTQHGWTWTIRDEFMEYIRKRGADNVNVSHMIADLAPLGRELFPNDLRKELLESMFDVTKSYFTIDDSITPITEPDNAHSEAEKTFLYQSKDTKPDPGIGIGVELVDSPPPSPQNSPTTTTTRQSPGPTIVTNAPSGPRQSPVQNTPRQSPGTAPRHTPSPVSVTPRPLTPQPLPPPPVLRPETVSSSVKSEPVVAAEEEEEEQEDEDDEEEEDLKNNEDEDEDELMDV